MIICSKCRHIFPGPEFCCPVCKFEPEMIMGYPAFAPEKALENEGFPLDGHERLFDLETKHFWFNNRNQMIIWALGRYFSKIQSFCEVGCGTGFVLSCVAKARSNLQITGTEIYSSALSLAAKRLGKKADLLQVDVCSFPFSENFDVIGAFDVLEHIEDDAKALASVFRAVKPGGGTIITVPQHQWLWSKQDQNACHKRRYNRLELKQKMKEAGFESVKIQSFMSLLLPFMIVSRFYKKSPKSHNRNNYGGINELFVPPIVNTVFGNICSLERWLIKKGCQFPAGGSLLAIGTKGRTGL